MLEQVETGAESQLETTICQREFYISELEKYMTTKYEKYKKEMMVQVRASPKLTFETGALQRQP